MSATLHVVFGPCGAGKTTYANAFARRERAVPLILDEWGARLFGPDVRGAIDPAWMLERMGRCATLMRSTAVAVLGAGSSVVLDMGLMRRADRDRIRQTVEFTGLHVQWHFVDAPQAVRRARIAARNAGKGETFVMEVTPEMFEFLESVYEAPDAGELTGAIVTVSE
jgi:predicted kinase